MAIMNTQPMSTDESNPKLAGKLVASEGERMDIDGDGADLPVQNKESPSTNGTGATSEKAADTNASASSPVDPPLTAASCNTQEFLGLHITSPDPHASMQQSLDDAVSPTDTSGLQRDVVVKEDGKKDSGSGEGSAAALTNGVKKSKESKDEEMPDAPSGKVSRSREDDEMLEPPPKRAKTEDSQDERESKTDAGTSTNRSGSGQGLPKAQTKFALAIIKNLRRSKDAAPFTHPVDPVALNIPSYPTIIKHPMDLSTMEKKINEKKYNRVEEFADDFNLIITNCITFNGPEHPISAFARNIQAIFERQYKQMPAADTVEPPTPEKKSHKKKSSVSTKKSTPAPPPAPAKKEAPKAQPAKAASHAPAPKSKSKTKHVSPPSTASPTFAVGPSGVPLIRRESQASGDGRPKREIHPPPPRDLPYSDVKPRKKKFAVELKFCDLVLKELYKKQYASFAFVFYNPVDPVALNIPDYYKIIKKPMDMSTIGSKLKTNQYSSAAEFEADIRLMLNNCFKFNPPGSPVHIFGQKMQTLFDSKWGEKANYIAQNTQAESRSPASASPVPEEEAHSDEEEDPEISKLQKQLQEMQEQLMMMKGKKNKDKEPSAKKSSSKKAAPPPAPPKKSSSAKRPIKRDLERTLSVDEKYELSEKINSLSTSKLKVVTKMIKEGAPKLAKVSDDELELDIDELPNSLLVKLHAYVTKNSEPSSNKPPSSRETTGPFDYHTTALAEVSPVLQSAPASRPKKNKPMSATEQEAKIASLQKKLASFESHKPGGQHIEAGGYDAASDSESSDDDEESGSSEEE